MLCSSSTIRKRNLVSSVMVVQLFFPPHPSTAGCEMVFPTHEMPACASSATVSELAVSPVIKIIRAAISGRWRLSQSCTSAPVMPPGVRKVRDHSAKIVRAQKFQAIGGALCQRYLVSPAFQRDSQEGRHRRLVLDQQNLRSLERWNRACFHYFTASRFRISGAGVTGMRTVNVQPTPSGLFFALISPRCARTMP